MRTIQISVFKYSCTTVPADLLILKYPQAFEQGSADSTVNKELAKKSIVVETDELRPGCSKFYECKHSIASREVVFCGVNPINTLYYPDITEFIELALSQTKNMANPPTCIATTMHGLHFGLDLSECIKAILSGLLNSMMKGTLSKTVSELIITEPSPALSDSYTKELEQLLPGLLIRYKIDSHGRFLVDQQLASRMQAASAHVFVAMPFSDRSRPVFVDGIELGVTGASCAAEIVDLGRASGDINERIHQSIRRCDFIIADLTGGNVNVYFELGYAMALKKPAILISQDDFSHLPFDVKTLKVIRYNESRLSDLAHEIKAHLLELLTVR